MKAMSSVRARPAGRWMKPAATHAILLAYSGVALVPPIIVLFASFKTVPEFFQAPYSLPKTLALSNYSQAWSDGNLPQAFVNSIVVTIVSVFISTSVAALAAYAVVRFRPRFSTWLQLGLIAGLGVPVTVIIIPISVEVRLLGLAGSIAAIAFPYCGLLVPVAFLILVNFIRTIPKELSEAATLDGCTHLQAFWRVELPLLRPALATVAILNGIGVWNDFLLPLVLGNTTELHTVPVAIVQFFGANETSFGELFATVIMASAPAILVYALLSRQFVEGIAQGAVK